MADILIVDGDRSVRDSMYSWLSRNGHSVTLFSSPRELASDLSSLHYDIAFVDTNLSGAALSCDVYDGYSLVKDLKKVYPGRPIVLMSGHGERPDYLIADAFLQKPFRFATNPTQPNLDDTINRLIGGDVAVDVEKVR